MVSQPGGGGVTSVVGGVTAKKVTSRGDTSVRGAHLGEGNSSKGDDISPGGEHLDSQRRGQASESLVDPESRLLKFQKAAKQITEDTRNAWTSPKCF